MCRIRKVTGLVCILDSILGAFIVYDFTSNRIMSQWKLIIDVCLFVCQYKCEVTYFRAIRFQFHLLREDILWFMLLSTAQISMRLHTFWSIAAKTFVRALPTLSLWTIIMVDCSWSLQGQQNFLRLHNVHQYNANEKKALIAYASKPTFKHHAGLSSGSWKGLTSWLSFVMSECEFATFPLVSWVWCGTWLYRFLIFALFHTRF